MIVESENASNIQDNTDTFTLKALYSDEIIPLSGEMVVGREAESDIPLYSKHVSRYHAKLRVRDDNVLLEDLGSTNGTFLNGERLFSLAKLEDGDEISFYDLSFRFSHISSESTFANDATLLAVPASNMPAEARDAQADEQLAQNSVDKKIADQKPVEQPKPAEQKAAVQQHDLHQEAANNPEPLEDEIPPSELFYDDESGIESIEALINDPLNDPPTKDKIAPSTKQLDEPDFDAFFIDDEVAEPATSSPAPQALQPQAPKAEPQTQNEDEPGEFTRMFDLAEIDSSAKFNKAFLDTPSKGTGARFVVLTAPLRGKIYNFQEAIVGTQWKIGRSPDSDIYISDKSIALDHAVLVKEKAGYTLSNQTEDIESVVVNNDAQSNAVLNCGDMLEFGRIKMIFKTDLSHSSKDGRSRNEHRQARAEKAMMDKSRKTKRFVVLGITALMALAAATVLFV